jgi:hypothetical protein
VACDGCIANWYYFDHGGDDWNCGSSTYGGHRGSDFSLAGGNGAIDDGYDVVAAADGDVVAAEDGYYDHCTACGGDGCGTDYGWGYGNHVTVETGSYRISYAHMRTGSVRVGVGDRVTCGQVLGQIGSSGCSTGAHLHFEVRPRGGDYDSNFDPFEGGCSPTSPALWVDQGAYRGLPSSDCEGPPPPTCPDGTNPTWTCVDGGAARRRCIDGVDEVEDCPWGCVAGGAEDLCAAVGDGDGDGFTADVDCDDSNASRHPGATEVCDDGVDQNCDGADDVCPPVPPDSDDDGYGQDVDCDDADPDRYPGAPEVCGDRVDQDCDGADEACGDGGPVPDGALPGDGSPGHGAAPLGPMAGGCGCGAAGRPADGLRHLVGALLGR